MTITNIVRWSDNTEDLKTHLAEGLDQIEAMRASTDRLVKSFTGEKLIQAAHNVTAAILEMGGATKLSTEQQARSFGTLSKAIETLDRQGRAVPASMRQMADQLRAVTTAAEPSWAMKLTSEVGRMAAGFISATAVIGVARQAWAAFTGFLSSSVKAFTDAESAQSTLTAALRSQSMLTPAVTAQYASLGKEIERTTVFQDDAVTSMQALLIQVGGVMPSKMKEALKASTDLAAGLGIDLQSATTLVAKAAAGHTETLGRYGITVSEAALQTKGFDATLEAINRQFGGQAAAQIETYAGQIKQAGNAWNNVQEAVGKYILTNPTVVRSLEAISTAAKDSAESTEGVKSSFVGLVSWIPIVGDKLAYLTDVLEKYTAEANSWDAAQRRIAAGAGKGILALQPDPLPDKTRLGLKAAADLADADAAAKKRWEAASIAATKAALDFAKAVETIGYRAKPITADVELLSKVLKFEAIGPPKIVQLTDSFEQLAPAVNRVLLPSEKLQGVLAGMPPAVLSNTAAWKQYREEMARTETTSDKVRSKLQDVDTILSNIGGTFAEVGAIAARTGSAILENLAEGDLWGAVVAGATGAITAIQKLWSSLTGGPSQAELDTRKLLQDWQDGLMKTLSATQKLEAGGSKWAASVIKVRDAFVATGRSAHDGVAAVQRMLDAKTPEAFARALEPISAVLEELDRNTREHAEDLARAKELIEEYGLAMSQLGSAWNQQQLTEKARSLGNDLRIMVDVLGIGFPEAARIMAGKFNDLANISRTTGTEIPANLKPIYQSLIDQGLLLDEGGRAFVTLEEAGLSFAETLTQGIDRIVDRLDQLLRGLGLIPNALPDPFRDWQTPEMPTFPNPNPDAVGAETAAVNAALTGGSVSAGGTVVIHLHNTMDGRVVSEIVSKHQMDAIRNRTKSRAA